MYPFSPQFWADMGLRLTGPAAFRFILQPILAVLYGVRDGVNDAKRGQPPYVFDIVMVPADRKRQAASGWAGIGKAVIFATVFDAVIQYMILGMIYPGAAIIVGVVCMAIPYVLARGITNRLVSRMPSIRATRQGPPLAPSGDDGDDGSA